MDRFESFLASKERVMAGSSGVLVADFPPLSSGARSDSSQYGHRQDGAP